MATEGAERFRDDLLVEQLAAWLGFAALADRLPGDVYPPYLFYGTVLAFDYGVMNTYKHLTGGTHALVDNPFVVTALVGVVLALVGIRYMRNAYARTLADLRVQDRVADPEAAGFTGLAPLRAKLALWVVGVTVLMGHHTLLTGWDTILAYEGVVHTVVVYGVVMPLVYLPLVVEFVATYFSIHVVLPRQLARSDIGLFFFDPRGMGGLAPVGQLLKRSYYLYTLGLVLYLVFVYGPYLVPQFVGLSYPAPGLFDAAFFTVAWLAGIASISYSLFRVHRFMAREKADRIRDLERQLEDAVDDPYDISSAGVVDEAKFQDVERRLERVQRTREYPTTFTMWSQIGASVLLPQALQTLVTLT